MKDYHAAFLAYYAETVQRGCEHEDAPVQEVALAFDAVYAGTWDDVSDLGRRLVDDGLYEGRVDDDIMHLLDFEKVGDEAARSYWVLDGRHYFNVV